MKIFQPIISGSFTTSGSVFLKGLTSAAQSNVVLIDTATGQLYTTASSALGGGGGGGTGNGFPFTGTAQITGSLIVTNTIQLDATLTDYASVNSTIVGSNNLYTQATGSYTCAFMKYTVSNGANSRAGEFIVNWNDSLPVEYTDISTKDIGSTSDVVFNSVLVIGNIQINSTTATSGWKIKTLATFI